ncbi:pirin family protein [uncultured Paenalcaligenes sp.]|uniref:pirin family protein n=1 Tax=uncultured Paenalcaligenes sp. TaxID=1588925 RepID=UPI00260F57F7|nr:pirin family protein [uncultured Paenalcaligenes sp.]
MKAIIATISAPKGHWVGDGFPVRSLFSYHGTDTQLISPFLLLDYAGPAEFTPHTHPRGVGSHPHRGFETVTLVYDGEVTHTDSTGGGGTIGPGDVQWMTAGDGILHKEYHSESFTKTGGRFEMVQLWVNLPAKDKTTPAHYQAITAAMIPTVTLPEQAGQLRVIAGSVNDTIGPATTYTPINVWDIQLQRGGVSTLQVPEHHTCLLVVLSGTVLVNDKKVVRDAELVIFDRSGTTVQLEANNDAKLLVLTGEPINEPVVGYGPFVMNTTEQIHESITAFNQNKMGQML